MFAQRLSIHKRRMFMKRITDHYIRRIGFSLLALSILVTALAVANWAQQPTALSSRSVYYDTFNEQWLNPAKWLTGLDCGPLTLECVREIQNGQLRLATRQFGATDSDSGIQFADRALFFSNPDTINSIASDITLQSFR
jgi:hypothetical protein